MVKNKFLILIGIIILFLDQLTKQLVKKFSVSTQGHFLDLTYITNTGTLFSLFSKSNYINIVFIVLSLIAIGIIYYLGREEKNKTRKIAYTVIVAGIFGNLIDRVLHGSVIDFINFHFWPVFNIADSALVIGVIIALYSLLKEKK